jgi:hypothetical protein
VAELIYPTQRSFTGPWLFDQASMDSLDAVIDEQWSQLETNKKRLIENAVKREKSQADRNGKYEGKTAEQRKELDKVIREAVEGDPTYDEDGRVVTLTLLSGKKVRDPTLKGAGEHMECQVEYVKKLEVSLVCAGVKVNLAVPSAEKKTDLQIVTLPEGSEQAKEAFVKLTIWADNYRPGWLRVLNGFPAPLVGPLFIFLLLPFVFLAAALKSQSEPSLQQEATELLKDGITPTEYGKALTLLLRKEYKTTKEAGFDEVPFWLWIVIVVFTICAVLLMITATTAFAIGRGNQSVRWQKWYGYMLGTWVPGFLISGVLASVVAAIISDRLRAL